MEIEQTVLGLCGVVGGKIWFEGVKWVLRIYVRGREEGSEPRNKNIRWNSFSQDFAVVFYEQSPNFIKTSPQKATQFTNIYRINFSIKSNEKLFFFVNIFHA